MRPLNAPSYANTPNDSTPFLGSDRPGYIGRTGLPNPYLLKVAPDTALWQNQVMRYNRDPRYGIVATVGLCGESLGVPTSGTFVDLGDNTRFHVNRFARTDPRLHYPMRPIVQGNSAARVNPYAAYYSGGYTNSLPVSMSDQLSAMLAKPGTGYAG